MLKKIKIDKKTIKDAVNTEYVSAIDEIVLLEQGMALEWSEFWKPIG